MPNGSARPSAAVRRPAPSGAWAMRVAARLGSLRWGRFFLLFWAFGTFFIMAEEISWGQRIFGIETPDSLKELNYQGEISLHNLQIVYDMFTSSETGIFRVNAFSLLMMLIGFVFPLIALTRIGRRLIQKFAFPVIPACYTFLFVGALIYGKVLRDFAVDPTTPPEIREFMWALGILAFALHGMLRPADLYRVTPPE